MFKFKPGNESMKRFRVLFSLCLIAILGMYAIPTLNAHASSSAQETIVASAVIVPAQVSQLGFIASALVKEIMVKEGDQVHAGQVLVVLNTPELQFALTAAEAALHSAQANAELQRYKRVKDRRNGKVFFDVLPPEIIAMADVKVIQAQASLEIAQATLAQNTLIAPYDAIVASVDVLPGEFVGQGQVVITLAALNNLQLETTDLSERDITKVKIGDTANIFVEALNENVGGEVIGISPIADRVGGDVVFKVTIAFDEQPDGLLWGMTAEVNIIGE